MEELFSNFGIDPKLLFAQAFNFALLFFVLQRFVFSKLIAQLAERKEKIAQGLEMREQAVHELSRASALKKQEIEAGKQEAGAILSNARTLAQEKMLGADEAIQEKSKRLLEAAKESGVRAKQEIIEGAKGEIAEIALLALERMWKKGAVKEAEGHLAKEVAAALKEYSHEQ